MWNGDFCRWSIKLPVYHLTILNRDSLISLCCSPWLSKYCWTNWTKPRQWNKSFHWGCDALKNHNFTILASRRSLVGPSASCDVVITQFGHYTQSSSQPGLVELLVWLHISVQEAATPLIHEGHTHYITTVPTVLSGHKEKEFWVQSTTIRNKVQL